MSVTSRVLKSGTVVSSALAAVALLGGASGVLAQAQPPFARVFGSIQVNGANAASGAVVTAYSGTTLCGTAQGTGLYTGTQYFVDLDSSQAACSPGSNTITFKINGQAANESLAPQSSYVPGSAVQLNLTGPASGGTSSASVSYQTGWNLVAGPSGTVFSQAFGPLYTFPAGATNYTQVPNTQAVSAGAGYWAYFSAPTTVSLTGNTALPVTVTAPAGQYIMAGNPTSTQTVSISGADIAYTYDPVSMQYAATTTLRPGQAAWVYSAAGGAITLQ